MDVQSKEENDDDNINTNNNEIENKKRKYVKHQRPMDVAPIIDQVNWVQCNKCTKWRKVPGSIDVESLPDIWYCNLNTWEPLMAKCSVKEDSTEPSIISPQLITEDDYEKSNIANNRPKRAASSTNISQQQQHSQSFATSNNQTHNQRNSSKEIITDQPGNKGIKKVTQWVQCERRNCKKWRKVPVTIDFESLPEKWFCEMNIWNVDRASCDGPEESDSETEQESAHTGRSQLLLANSKGPKDLSYRRIIFGTDGRIRPCYNEKNKNGFGLFSFTELHRPNDMGDYIEPTRRVSYWWSSAFDEKGSDFISAKMRHPGSTDNKKEKQEIDKLDIVINNKNIDDFNDGYTSTILLDAAKRFDNYHINNINEPNLAWPKHKSKFLKMTLLENKISTFDRLNYECSIVRSCLLNSLSDSLLLSQLIKVISTSTFINPIEEFCRVNMNLSCIKSAIRRLELEGEAQITRNSNDDIIITILGPIIKPDDPLHMMSDGAVWGYSGIPLKMRKAVDNINEIRSDKLKEEEEKEEILKRIKIQEEIVENDDDDDDYVNVNNNIINNNIDEEIDIDEEIVIVDVDVDKDLEENGKGHEEDDLNGNVLNKEASFLIISNDVLTNSNLLKTTSDDDSIKCSNNDSMQICNKDVLIEEVDLKKIVVNNSININNDLFNQFSYSYNIEHKDFKENNTSIEKNSEIKDDDSKYSNNDNDCDRNNNIVSMEYDYNEKNCIDLNINNNTYTKDGIIQTDVINDDGIKDSLDDNNNIVAVSNNIVSVSDDVDGDFAVVKENISAIIDTIDKLE
jgi:hypothetical protein